MLFYSILCFGKQSAAQIAVAVGEIEVVRIFDDEVNQLAGFGAIGAEESFSNSVFKQPPFCKQNYIE